MFDASTKNEKKRARRKASRPGRRRYIFYALVICAAIENGQAEENAQIAGLKRGREAMHR